MKTILLGSLLAVFFFVAAGDQFTRPFPAAGQDAPDAPATAALQAEIDEQNRTLANLVARVAELTPDRPAIKTATMLGLRANDPKFDNGPLIQPALDAGFGVFLDGAGLYYTSPLRIRPGTASPIVGSSASYRHNPACTTGFAPFKPDQSHLIEIPGDATKSTGQVQVIRDLYLLGNENCDGIRIHGGDAVSIENCCLRRCKRGLLVDPTIRVYSVSIRDSSMLGCDTGIEVRNGKSVCCFSATNCEVITSRVGVFLDGWKRGATFIGVVCENQTEACFKMTDSKGSLIGCYLESGGVPGLRLKSSKLNVMDTSVLGISHSGDSQINVIGDCVQWGTLAYP